MSGSLTVSSSSTPPPLQITSSQEQPQELDNSQVDHFSEFADVHKGEALNEIFAKVNPADFPVIAQLSRLFNQIIWHPIISYQTIPTLNFRRWLCDKYAFDASKNAKTELLAGLGNNAPANFSEQGKQTLSKEISNLIGLEELFLKHFSDLNSSFYYENNLSNSSLLKLIHFQRDTELIKIAKYAQNLVLTKLALFQENLLEVIKGKKSDLNALVDKCTADDKKHIAQDQQTYANRMTPVHRELFQTRQQIAPLALAPPPINPIHQAARSRKIESLQRVVGIIAAAGSTWAFHWLDYVDESWKGVAALTHVGVSIAALVTLIPRSSGQPPQRFWHYRNYATTTSSIATFVCIGGAIFPRLISYTIPPEWQPTAKAAGWVVSGLLSYKLYSL